MEEICKKIKIDYGKVSIIMPSFNSEKFIKESINSIIEQTYSNWELIVIDDCSTDSTKSIVEGISDERIVFLQNTKNQGAAQTRNNGIEKASGRWIAFLDSDDLWKKDKLEEQLRFMCENSYSFTYTGYEAFKEDKQSTLFIPKSTASCYKDLLKHNQIGCLTVIYDSLKLGKVYMPTNAVKREDLACWLKILKSGEKGYCLRENLASYRIHSKSVSSNKFRMMKYQWRVYRKVEKLNFFKSVYYLTCWAINGVFKYK